MAEKFGIEIDGTDKSKKAFDSAGEGVDGLKNKLGGLSDGLKQAPEQFSKAQGALLLLQNTAGQAGGKFADAANKLTGLAGVAITGGPFGIALAAATAGIAALSFAFSELQAPVQEAEDDLLRFKREAEETSRAIRELTQEAGFFDDQLVAIGRSGIDAKLLDLRLDLADTTSRVLELGDSAAQVDAALRGFGKIERLKTQIAELKVLKEAQDAESKRVKRATREALRRRDIDRARARFEADEIRFLAQLEADEERKLIAARQKEEQRQAQAIDRIAQRRIAQIENQLALEETIARQKAANDDKEAARAAAAFQQGVSIATQLAAITTAKDEESREAAKAAAVDAAISQIQAAAAAGAAEAFKSFAGLGPLGPVLGAAAGAAVFTAINAFKGKILGLNEGGIVPGGPGTRRGQDSVPALLTPGELVVPESVVRQGGGGMGQTINVSASLQALDLSSVNAVAIEKLATNVGTQIQKQSTRGRIKKGAFG